MVSTRAEVVEQLDEAVRLLQAASVEAVEAERREDVYEVLRNVAVAIGDLDSIEVETVEWLRSWGGTWQDVANVYGVTRQAVSKRFGASA